METGGAAGGGGGRGGWERTRGQTIVAVDTSQQ